jgi:hypothetical protein
MIKNFTVIIALSLLATSANAQKAEWIPFKWVGARFSGKYFDKAAIVIPVTIENLPYKFNMQFDLGAVTTVIYGNSIAPYLEESKLKEKIDTSLNFVKNNGRYHKFRDISLKLGKVSFGKTNIGYYKGFGPAITTSNKTIGTAAPDLFKNKLLIIDYLNQRICVSEVLPKQFADVNFLPIKIRSGRIEIPFNIDGDKEYLLFDTGSSFFPLMTTKQRANSISDGRITDSVRVNSWGVYHLWYGENVTSLIKLGKVQPEPAMVYYSPENIYESFYEDENIWGITGNMYFLNHIVIIDYKNKRFGIK